MQYRIKFTHPLYSYAQEHPNDLSALSNSSLHPHRRTHGICPPFEFHSAVKPVTKPDKRISHRTNCVMLIRLPVAWASIESTVVCGTGNGLFAIPSLRPMCCQTYSSVWFAPMNKNQLATAKRAKTMSNYPRQLDFIFGWFLCLLLAIAANSLQSAARHGCIVWYLHMYRPFTNFRESSCESGITVTIHVTETESNMY